MIVVFTCREIPVPASAGLAAPGGWGRTDLTFSVGAAPPGIGDNIFHAAVCLALDTWKQAVPFQFTEVPSGGTLYVAGVPARHDDGVDFVPGTPELAHAFGPVTGGGTLDGQVHLNDTRTWADGTGADADVLTIVLHELGHALGIVGHFGNDQTVMNGSFPAGLVRRVLTAADTAAIRGLYPGFVS